MWLATSLILQKWGWTRHFCKGPGRPGHAPPAEPGYAIDGCLVPAREQAIVSGLQPGWFDLYWSDLSHQFIEISGVSDGVYELESVANVEGRIEEASLANTAGA